MRRSLAVLLIALVVLVASARARIVIDITQPGFAQISLALKIKGTTEEEKKLANELFEVIRDDLILSGLFDFLDPVLYVEPEDAPIAPPGLDFSAWQILKAELLIKGQVTVEAGELLNRVVVELRAYDVFRQQMILGRRYRARKEEIARIGHKFCDYLLKEFTGKPGAFDSYIAYVSDRGGVKRIYLTMPDGKKRTLLTPQKRIHLSPSFSPDVRRLVFSAFESNHPCLFSMDLTYRRLKELCCFAGLNLGADFSPDGSRLVITLSKDGNPEIYLLDSRTGRILKRLTSTRWIEVSPTFSPDGTKIAFASDRTGSPQIYVMNADGSGLKRITFEGKYNVSPAWSPDGKKIVYASMVGAGFDLFVVDLETLEVERLTENEGSNEDPVFSPDGRFIAFSSNRYGNYDIFIMNFYTRTQKRLTRGRENDTNPAWSHVISE